MFEFIKTNKKLWDIFTKKEEYQANQEKLDRHQRFSYKKSNYQNISEPIVSKFLIKKGFKIKYPNKKKFAVCLTHDIDAICLPKLANASLILRYIRKKETKKAIKAIVSYLIKEWNPWWNFNQIISFEKKYNAKSSFYFLVTNKGINKGYRIKNLKKELININNQGWEVGLHGGYWTYNNIQEIKKEKRKLEKIFGGKIIGFRSHYLRFKTPDTWELLKKAKFKYDTTFGYPDMIGFRNGICHPFKPFNLETNREIDILEIPLIIMDGTLFNYMKLSNNQAWKIIKSLIDETERYNGVITILWHNNYFFGEKLKLYKKILSYCYKKDAWMTSGKEVWKFWSKNKHRFISG